MEEFLINNVLLNPSFWVSVASAIIMSFLFFNYLYKKEFRIFRNLNRSIFIFSSDDSLNLRNEYDTLKSTKLCKNISQPEKLELKSLDKINKFSVVIIGYSSSYQYYSKVFDLLKSKGIPVIVYAPREKVIPAHMDIVNQYLYWELCNIPSRILPAIFNLALIISYEKE